MLGVAKDVAFLGAVLNPLPYIKRATALVNTANYAGWENVLAEALAVGTPAIATDCDFGPREILAGGEFGTLAPPGDVDAIAQALARLVDCDPATAAAERTRGRQRAQDFTAEKSARRYADLIEGIMVRGKV
jgi:glycosyltransferase involved in cell wall biosynthesis